MGASLHKHYYLAGSKRTARTDRRTTNKAGGSHPGLVVMVAKGRSSVENPGPTSDGDERAVRLEQRAL